MLFPRFRFALRLPLVAAVAAYGIALMLLGGTMAFTIKHLGTALPTEVASVEGARQNQAAPPADAANPSGTALQRDGAMTPLYDRFDGR